MLGSAQWNPSGHSTGALERAPQYSPPLHGTFAPGEAHFQPAGQSGFTVPVPAGQNDPLLHAALAEPCVQ